MYLVISKDLMAHGRSEAWVSVTVTDVGLSCWVQEVKLDGCGRVTHEHILNSSIALKLGFLGSRFLALHAQQHNQDGNTDGSTTHNPQCLHTSLFNIP